jgi:hypothetical protein
VLTAHISGLAAMDDALHTARLEGVRAEVLGLRATASPSSARRILERMNWAGIGEDNIDGIFKRLKEHTEARRERPRDGHQLGRSGSTPTRELRRVQPRDLP